jgi:Protein of unknown function (DUF3168)
MTTFMLMSEALQRAIVTRLKSDTALMALVNGVFDDVPHATPLPYITFATAQVTDQSTRHITIAEISLPLHIWSDYTGKDQVLTIMQRVETLLTKASLTLSDGRLISLALVRSEVSTQGGDVQRRRGRMEYSAQIETIVV